MMMMLWCPLGDPVIAKKNVGELIKFCGFLIFGNCLLIPSLLWMVPAHPPLHPGPVFSSEAVS